jgi:hypothetical protein
LAYKLPFNSFASDECKEIMNIWLLLNVIRLLGLEKNALFIVFVIVNFVMIFIVFILITLILISIFIAVIITIVILNIILTTYVIQITIANILVVIPILDIVNLPNFMPNWPAVGILTSNLPIL